MSIYRDTYVSIDGEYDKINAAYSYGGPELALRTIPTAPGFKYHRFRHS